MSASEDRRCLLVAEVSGSARISEKLGAAEMQHAVLRCLHRMERVSNGFKGQLLATPGEVRIRVLFDSAETAHLAACEMQQRVLDLPPVSGVKLEVQAGYGPLPEDAAAVSQAARLAGRARPGQILISGATRQALPQLLQRSTAMLDAGDDVFEVIWRQAAALPGRLSLRHGGVVLVLGCDKPEAALGRDPLSEIIIKNPRASRNHARIKWRRDSFLLIDQSSNGTFVTFAGSQEIPLKREEIVLHGRGVICCGSAYGEETDEIVEFDCSTVEVR